MADNAFQERLKREKEARKAKRKKKKGSRGKKGRAAFVENYEFPPKRKSRRKSKVRIAYASEVMCLICINFTVKRAKSI